MNGGSLSTTAPLPPGSEPEQLRVDVCRQLGVPVAVAEAGGSTAVRTPSGKSSPVGVKFLAVAEPECTLAGGWWAHPMRLRSTLI